MERNIEDTDQKCRRDVELKIKFVLNVFNNICLYVLFISRGQRATLIVLVLIPNL